MICGKLYETSTLIMNGMGTFSLATFWWGKGGIQLFGAGGIGYFKLISDHDSTSNWTRLSSSRTSKTPGPSYSKGGKAIHRMNHCPVDNSADKTNYAIHRLVICPVPKRYPTFEQ